MKLPAAKQRGIGYHAKSKRFYFSTPLEMTYKHASSGGELTHN